MAESAPHAPEPSGKHANSRYALAAFLAAIFAVWTLRATWLYRIDEQLALPITRAGYSNAVKVLLWLAPAAIYSAAIGRGRARRSLRGSFGLATDVGLRTWLHCLLVTLGFLLAVASVDMTVGHKKLSTAKLLDPSLGPEEWLACTVLQFLVSPLIEELFFRGFLLRTMLEGRSLWTATLFNSFLFVGIHWPFWLSHRESWSLFASHSFGVFCFSLVACWLYHRARTVWPPTLAHVLNNLLASMLVIKL